MDFRVVYQTELTYVWNTLRRLGIPSADVEDACHEVFLVVHRRFDTYDPTRPLRPWLFGITYRVASWFRRRHKAHLAERGVDSDERETAPEVIERKRQQRVVQRALEHLPMEQRVVFILHELDQFAAPEIADALSVPLNTTYSRLRLARVAFAKAVAAERLHGGVDG